MSMPLDGIRILDLSRYLAGPYATMLLAEYGATVIKVEKPGVGDETRQVPPIADGHSHYFSSVNRSKKSVEIDLGSATGKKLIRRLAADSDVLVENFRPGVMETLGIGYDTLKLDNDRLIYCAISGFGTTGAYRDHPAFDLVGQGEAGIMSLNGEAGGPPLKLGLPLGDLSSGMFAVQGVLAALFRRSQTGVGGRVDVSLFDSLLSFSSYYAQNYFMTGVTPPRMGSSHHSTVPYGVFPTKDQYIVLAGFGDKFWIKLVNALGAPELASDARFADGNARLRNRAACEAAVNQLFSTWLSEPLVALLTEVGVPCGMVRDLGQALDSEHAKASGSVGEVRYPRGATTRAVRSPVRFDGEQCPMAPAPDLGADNAVILKQYLPENDQ